jgi:stage II sporulation protein D
MPLNRALMVILCTGLMALLDCTPNPIYRQYRQGGHYKSAAKPSQNLTSQKIAAAPNIHENDARSARSAREISAPETGASETDADSWSLEKDNIPVRPSTVWRCEGLDFHVPTAYVRVLLRSNAADFRIVSSGPLAVRGAVSLAPAGMVIRDVACIGRGATAGRVRCAIDGGESAEIALPCTLYSSSEFNIVKIEDDASSYSKGCDASSYTPAGASMRRPKGCASYRGSVIVSPDGPGFSVANYLTVDDYLRGVVPLEVGKGSDDVIEAVKAQAVAARTYTYRKMQENAGNPFDLSATVSDQVYGGIAAESELCNKAIRSTQGEVMAYHDSLVYAYYHSTCGGRTANIEDVWNKSDMPYLRSVDDGDAPYCGQSSSFSWEERWPLPQFSFIVNKYSHEAFPQNPCHGEIRDISIRSRFRCGRTRELCIKTSEGEFLYGGDKLRFALRRNTAGFPILKSCLLTEASVREGSVVIKGRGYGHGVGMCQTGALGRARSGKDYKEIIKAYYTGIEIKKIIADR